ncbi:aminopeptidase N [Shewanella gelidii]|uniref:Aminopeptidase N n=1 Tax=Shewanella gelidii TaxID=1642821 RepID=A0A917JML8_9GAMM|nr:aminopeptidase N [Shewanella gelidii]MCL1099299.1 aminopeptidase N [Shewanella gelidii]GGI77603.1 aminopeptidase N [Shewanella gelidii]
MGWFRSIIITFICLYLAACTSTTTPFSRDDSQYITQQQAHHRASRVSNVQYFIQLTADGSEHFRSKNKIEFDLADTQSPLSIDIHQAQIDSLKINGHWLYPKYNGSYLKINPKMLVTGHNTIEVSFTREHSTNGEGWHRFKDPIDQQVYLYSHFEPAAAQQVFALFDQPDIKAKFQLSVTVPKTWQVVSATREISITPSVNNPQMNTWQFPATKTLSPYNFSVHAGPYQVWQDGSGKYPLRLFARQSVAKQVTPETWFSYTQRGLTFFEDYFGIDYPFQKYDQLLVPEFLYGAMENAAAITFSEQRFLPHGPATQEQLQRTASVIMHEMAHQWFGNLVTMKWWNGLWLNESFASFMGILATAEATEFTHAWRTFYSKGKRKAYLLDSRVTTHPIETPVPSTKNAFDNIDAITYAKGSAVLAQLNHFIGTEVFRQGVHNYLKKFSYQNAELNDFINSLGEAAKRDLSGWSQDWLYQAGVNTVSVEWQCRNQQIAALKLVQTAPDQIMPLREQSIQLALFKEGRREMHLSNLVAVSYADEVTEVPSLIGTPCPDLIYPNYQDWGYLKVALDKKSFTTAQRNLSKFKDPLLRSMLWLSLWDSVEAGELTLQQYLGSIFVNAPQETDATILKQITQRMLNAKDLLAYMQPSQRNYANKAVKGMQQMSLRKVMESWQSPPIQRLWFETYIALASNMDSLHHLKQLLVGELQIAGLSIDQSLRWKIIKQLNRYATLSSRQLLRQEKERDPSNQGRQQAIAADVLRPEAKNKRDWFNRVQQNSLPFADARIVMAHLYPAEQRLLSKATTEQRLNDWLQLDATNGPVFMRAYSQHLVPKHCNHANIQAINQQLEKQTPQQALSVLSHRALLEAKQDDEICVSIKQNMHFTK